MIRTAVRAGIDSLWANATASARRCPTKGTQDMVRVLKALKETGYSYGIDPDHVPRSADDPKGYYHSYTYSVGYINAMIQAVYGGS